MIKCVPTPTDIKSTQISFSVSIVDANTSIDAIHTMYGGGIGYSGKKIGEASMVLGRCGNTMKTQNKTKVLYLAGYREDGKEFCVETEKAIVEACEQAAKAIWG